MNPLNIIFQSVSTLTGGLVNDVTSLIVAMVSISFVLMALDLIKDALDNSISSHNEKARREEIEEEAEARYLDVMAAEGKGDVVAIDLAKSRYKKVIRKA
ncbi:MAG: hypothetical protein HZB31_06100 [Nitrospirae bacterium]|nr:hypothetical protein [Nitrospirota bacterium]